MLSAGSDTYSYDANGSTVSEVVDGQANTYTYNSQNELVGATVAGITQSMRYDADGIRIGKTSGGEATDYLTDSNRDYAQVLYEKGSSAELNYTFGLDLVGLSTGAEDYTYHTDALGSTRALTSSAATVSDAIKYDAWGEVLDGNTVADNQYLYTGEQYDAALDKVYLRARYYTPGIGRFERMDDFIGKQLEPKSLHKYLYGNGSPTDFIDPSGYIAVSLSQAGVTSQIVSVMNTIAIAGVRSFGGTFVRTKAGRTILVAASACVANYAATHFGMIMPIAQFSACDGSVHRGRWQAQGNGLQKSVSWNQPNPVSLAQGLNMLYELRAKLTPQELRARATGFAAAEIFANRATFAGGITGPVSRNWPQGAKIRVDLEIIKGRAFLPY